MLDELHDKASLHKICRLHVKNAAPWSQIHRSCWRRRPLAVIGYPMHAQHMFCYITNLLCYYWILQVAYVTLNAGLQQLCESAIDHGLVALVTLYGDVTTLCKTSFSDPRIVTRNGMRKLFWWQQLMSHCSKDQIPWWPITLSSANVTSLLKVCAILEQWMIHLT